MSGHATGSRRRRPLRSVDMRVPDFEALMAADDRLGKKARMNLVAPYYLKLMGTGILGVDEKLVVDVGRRGRRATDDDVRLMLAGTWRPLVMGAWYAIAHEDAEFSEPIHDALETCLGHLTSPALIAAVIFYPSKRTLPLLADYAATDRLKSWGAADLADAARDRLSTERADLGIGTSLSAERAMVDALLARGALLRHGHAQGRWRATLSKP